MPYIKDYVMRKILDKIAIKFMYATASRDEAEFYIVGNLNYFLFKLAKQYCTNYSTYQQFIGELECAKSEIERRLLAQYEDTKIRENGDVE